jgi:hypothetical protein
VDPGIYVLIKEGELCVLALYVDGSIIVGTPGSFIVGFNSALLLRDIVCVVIKLLHNNVGQVAS